MKLFHGSAVSGLRNLLPNKATGKDTMVYATHNWVLAFVFAGRRVARGKRIISVDGCGYVTIRVSGPSEVKALLGHHSPVAIYRVDPSTFHPISMWDAEVLSTVPAPIHSEEVIEDFGVMLQKLLDDGAIKLSVI